MARKLPNIIDPTPEEDAKIRADIASDPDTWEITADAVPIHVGHPNLRHSEEVTLWLDKDIIAALKGDDPKGWQTRLNAAARAGLGLD